MIDTMYALKISQGTEDVIILYFLTTNERKNTMIGLFSVKDQIQVSTWTESIDGKITEEHHYDTRKTGSWLPR